MKIRKIVQLVFFLLILSVSIGHSLDEAGIKVPLISTASLHAVCPFGGVVSIYEFFVSGSYVKKIHESSFILMFVVFALAILLGPVFCGWICPFGTFQEWVSSLGKKIFKKRFNTFIPYKVDKYLRFTRYILLVLVLVKTAQSAQLMFANIDPYYALFNIWSDEVAITAYIILAITIILSLFVERPFCKYACPYGALLGITNTFKIFKIRRNKSTCIDCKLCDKKCPMNIPLSNVEVSRNHQCISCLECTSEYSCPKSGTLNMSFKNVVIKAKAVAPVIVVLFVLGVGGTMALNIWNTETTKIPRKYDKGEFAGEFDPADIRGSYALADIESSFNVPVQDLVDAFGLKDIKYPEEFQIKSLEEMYGNLPDGVEIGTDSVRYFVSLYTGLPYTPSESIHLLRPAFRLLKDRVSDETREYIQGILVDKPEGELGTTEIIEHEVSNSVQIKGKTTFKEVFAMGITEEELLKILGSLPKNLNMSVRDYCFEIGVEFSVVKDAFSE